MDVALIHNPSSGTGKHTRRDIERLLRRHGYHPKYCKLERALEEPAAFRRGKFVVAVGGDGTMRKVALELIGTGRILAPLPLGTANNIAQSLGIHGHLKDVIAGWKPFQTRPLDMGLAEGPWGRQPFIEGAGIGLIGKAMPILKAIGSVEDHEFDELDDKLHRDLCIYIALAHTLPPVRAQVTLNHRRPQNRSYLLLEFLNIGRAGPCIELHRRANPADGRLEVVAVAEKDRPTLLRHLTAHLIEAKPRPSLPRTQAKTVAVLVTGGCFRADGRILWEAKPGAARAKIRISVLPKSLDVLLPVS